MKLKAFLSDLDGTLIDTRERAIHAHSSGLHAIGHTIHPEQIRRLYQYSFDSRDLLNRLNIHPSDSEFMKYLGGFRQHFFSHKGQSKVIPGVVNTLKQVQSLTEHLRIITSRQDSQQTRQEIRFFGLDKWFEKIFTRGDLANAKGKGRVPLFPFLPQRRMLIRLALRDIKNEGEVWVVGDSAGELEAAKSLGCTTIGVLTGFGTSEDLAPFATHVINSFAEIVHLI
ncbi:MAG: HAD family hydrolase [Candidatus Hermodarchaeia archaeon]|jgi:phosphoglycolate phosphatase-like HAD superfamily hydrolase